MSARISWLDVKLGIRMMIKHPGLTLVGGLGLAVGIAISVGFYSFSSAFTYPKLPLDEGHRVVAIENRDIVVNNEDRRALRDFFTWREQLEAVEDLAAFRTVERNLVTGVAAPELVSVAEMTASAFRLARVSPLLGRHLVDEDEHRHAPPVIVIGYHVWRNLFAADPDVVGREVRLGGVVHTVVGVMPDGFRFPESHRFWTPLREDPSAYEHREGSAVFVAGRLAPGVTMEMAQAELAAIGRRMAADYPETHELLRPMVMRYTHSLSDVQGVTAREVVEMNAMMSLILVVIALNVAVLIYARTVARQGEIAVRHALGASRGRLVAQLFAEALVLSAAAAAAGLALASFGMELGGGIMELEYDVGVPFWLDLGLRPTTILVTVVAAVFAAVIIGVLPGLQATGTRVQSRLAQLAATRTRLGRTWTALIVAQIAVAVAALPAATNLGWAEIRRALTHRTFATEEFLSAYLVPEPPPPSDTAHAAASAAFGDRLTQIMRRLEQEPAVAGATFLAAVPGDAGTIRIEGADPPAESPAGHEVIPIAAHPDFLELVGATVLSGRALEGRDTAEGATAVVVTRAFVEQVLDGGEALGRHLRHESDEERAGSGRAAPVRWYEIVGVIDDLRANRVAPEMIRPEVYYPVAPDEVTSVSLLVRLRGSSLTDFAPRFRQLAADVDPSLRLGTVRSLADLERQGELAAQLAGLAVGLIVVSVMLLSAAGIYAMMAFTVTQRRREIGIRSALGAQPADVLRSVFSRAAAQIAVGLVVGVGAAASLEWLTGGGLVGGRGAVLLPTVAAMMALVSVLGIQPTEALKSDA